ncbi:MAG: nucleotide exchange factor GrpE [Proteobacteria bacterium]|nr:nucleotide exchange factor GrpE [Pseudomonadota bacterium]
MKSEDNETDPAPETAETPAAEPETDAAAAEEAGEEGVVEAAAAAPEEEDLEAKVADLKDKLLRALAEAENVRRRAERDKEDASKYAISNFARDMLALSDNLHRAMNSVDPETRRKDPAVEQIIVGLEMTARDVQATFERYGIKTIEAMGEKFDHNLHEALFEMDDASKPSGTVVQVVETGYVLKDRLLRPAKVGVSKGGPKETNAQTVAQTNTGAEAPETLVAKEGQTAYENKGEEPGGQLDEEL